MELKLVGNSSYLVTFTKQHLTDKYIGWLNNPENVRFSNQQFQKHSFESCEKFLDSFSDNQNIFMAIHTLDDQHVGTLTAYFNPKHGLVDVGILVGESSCWGKGIGLDAWNTIFKYLFDVKGVRKITAGTVRSNIGMIRIMEKSGMVLEAVRPKHLIYHGKEEDVLLYAKLSSV
jgi:ribosomal-protein-alanine N-acetyltransferase